MPIWDKQSISLQILYLCSLVWKIIPLYFLSSKIYNLLKTSPLIWKFLRFSSAQVKFCQIPCANFKTKSQFLSKFCILLYFHEKLLLSTFLAQIIYTLLKRNPLKWKILRLAQILPYANFETRSRFLSKFCVLRQFHGRLLLCTILAQRIYILLKKNPLLLKFLRILSAPLIKKLTNINRCLTDPANPCLTNV